MPMALMSLPTYSYRSIVIKLKSIEEGRRQRAEGRRNNWTGIQTPPNCKRRVDGGVLDPRPVWSRAECRSQNFLLPSASCPLPFLIKDVFDSVKYLTYSEVTLTELVFLSDNEL
jgi:hypothetical protein